jgi:signal transduction histidine kinase
LQGIVPSPVENQISTLVQAITESVEEQCSVKMVRVETSNVDGTIIIDPNHFKLILRNLLTNSIKFSKPGAIINLDFSYSPNQIAMKVIDHGVGMNTKQLQTIFQKEKLSSTYGTANEKGIGVGLLLVKEFIDANQAELLVESAVGKGSTFTVLFKQ